MWTHGSALVLTWAVAAWMGLAQEWQNSRLRATNARADLGTLAAASRLHQALREVARDGVGWASPALIASRTELRSTAHDLANTAANLSDLAGSYATRTADLVQAGQLTLPARHLVALERNARSDTPPWGDPDLVDVVAAGDVARNRQVPPSPRLAARLGALAQLTAMRMDAVRDALEDACRPSTYTHAQAAVAPITHRPRPLALVPDGRKPYLRP